MSGKVNIRCFDRNNQGGSKIRIQKAKGDDLGLLMILGIKLIRYVLEGLIEGRIKELEVHKFTVKNPKITELGSKIKCEVCDKNFQTDLGFKLHMIRMHKEEEKYCDICRVTLNGEENIKKHFDFKHTKIRSTKA